MILTVMAIRDRAINAYGQPMFFPAIGAGIRAFQHEIRREAIDNLMHHHPDDYDLYHLGTYDDATGQFDQLKQPVQVATGKQLAANSGGISMTLGAARHA